MRWLTQFFIIKLFLFLVAPFGFAYDFVDCHRFTSNDHILKEYGAAYNPHSNEQELIFKATCANTTVNIAVGNNDSNMYIHKKGYVLENGEWKEFLFIDANETDDWLIGSAEHRLQLTEQQLRDGVFYIAYTCFWNGTQWKCGCKDQECAESFWQLQKVTAEGSLSVSIKASSYEITNEVHVWTIPESTQDIYIGVTDAEDIDLRLYDEDGTKIIHPEGILNHHLRQSTDYKGISLPISPIAARWADRRGRI